MRTPIRLESKEQSHREPHIGARPVFVVWKGYQRRAELLSGRLGAELLFFPHLFRSKYLRPLDYLYKLVRTVGCLLRSRPQYVIAQAPPLFPVLACLLTRTPYVLDAHNSLFQSFWGRLPFSSRLIRRAKAVMVHNPEIREVAEARFPGARFFTLRDPIARIERPGRVRHRKQVLLVCSFDYDEPVDAIIEAIEAVPGVRFFVTADPKKLSPERRLRLEACPNVSQTGFLERKEYDDLLLSSTACVVLTTMPALQPSGACEALSSDTPLIVSSTSLTQRLSGGWATFIDNDGSSLAGAIGSLEPRHLDLSQERRAWNEAVQRDINEIRECLDCVLEAPGRELAHIPGRVPLIDGGSK